jgi:gp45 sliding clamp, C terminal
MQLNSYTMDILKNFSDIQDNILIEPGKIVKTLAQAGNILAEAELTQDFPAQMQIYDLKEFLSVLKLLDNPDITFHEKYVLISDSVGRSKVKYFFADINSLHVPKKAIVMPEAEISFEIDDKTINALRSASSVLGHEQFSTRKVDGAICLTVEDSKDSSSNKYSIDVPGAAPDTDFTMLLNVANIKVLPGDYIVSMSSSKISQWKNKASNLTYWIALDKKSTWNGK